MLKRRATDFRVKAFSENETAATSLPSVPRCLLFFLLASDAELVQSINSAGPAIQRTPSIPDLAIQPPKSCPLDRSQTSDIAGSKPCTLLPNANRVTGPGKRRHVYIPSLCMNPKELAIQYSGPAPPIKSFPCRRPHFHPRHQVSQRVFRRSSPPVLHFPI